MKNSDIFTWPLYIFGAIATFFAITIPLGYELIPVTVRNNASFFTMLGFYWSIGLYAYSYGTSDALKIDYGITIKHGRNFLLRTLWVLVSIYVMKVNILYIVSAGFFFSAIFNLNLNAKRHEDWWYIGIGNRYDELFLNLGIEKGKPFIESLFAIIYFFVAYVIVGI